MAEIMPKDGDPRPGDLGYVLERLADPLEKFTVVRPIGRGWSQEGKPTTLWLLWTSRGNEIVVDGRQLSQIPPHQKYQALRRGA